MSDAWLGFLGGVLATLVGALLASLVQRHNERKHRKEEARLDVYLMLMELHAQYFWVASSELHGEEPPKEVLVACREIAWKVADRLRKFDQVEYVEEILDILFNGTLSSANERANRLASLLDRIGQLVNPTYSRHISGISRANILAFGGGDKKKSYAPALWH